jgi:PBP1b-binding outer membrane lipoprotein LpoB
MSCREGVTFDHGIESSVMKKSVTIVVFLALVLGACSQYTCPTYSRTVEGKPSEAQKV